MTALYDPRSDTLAGENTDQIWRLLLRKFLAAGDGEAQALRRRCNR